MPVMNTGAMLLSLQRFFGRGIGARGRRARLETDRHTSSVSLEHLEDRALLAAASFQAIGLTDQFNAFGTGSIPPDTMGAVGPNHFVEIINSSVAIYNKTTGAQLSHVSLSSFFTDAAEGVTPATGTFDPRVLFDRATGRWFATAMERGVVSGKDNDIILAVSDTSDPTGDWDRYRIDVGIATGANAYFTDYSTLSVDENGVYFGMRIFEDTGNDGTTNTSFAKIAATPIAPLLAATPSLGPLSQWSDISDMYSSPQPAHNFDNITGTTAAWFVSSSTTTNDNINYRTLTWNAGVPTLSATSVLITNTPYAAPLNAPAQGSTTNVNVGDDRLQMAVIRNGSLWTARQIGLNSSGTASGADRTGVEWFQVNVSGATPSLTQSGRIFDNASSGARSYYYPSINVNGQGHARIGFSGSSSSQFIAAYSSYRLATDAPGVMSAPTLIKAGESSYTINDGVGRNRWGDYSYTSVDPNDDMTIWTLQEYAESGTNRWGTWVSSELAPAPTMNNPAGSGAQGTTSVSLNLTGTGFFDPGTGFPNRLAVQLTGGAVNGISNYAVTYNGPASATVTFDIALGASLGTRDIVLTNPDGQSVTIVNGFTVTPFNVAPVVDLDGPGGTNHYSTIFTEDGGPVAIADTDASITDGDDANLVSMTAVLDSNPVTATESLVIGGTTLALNADNAVTGTGGGTTFLATYTFSTRTLVINRNGGGTAPVGDFETLLRGITYNDVSQSPGTTNRTLSITVNDGVESSVAAVSTIQRRSVNDEPAGANNELTTNEDTDLVLVSSDFGFSDSDGNLLGRVQIVNLPASGTLKLNGVAVSAGSFITSANLDAGLLVFSPVADASGIPYTQFTFQVEDDGGTQNGGVNLDASANTITINVNPLNDAPTGQSSSLTLLEDGSVTVQTADFGYSDKESNTFSRVKVTTLPGAGTLKLSGVPVNAGDFILRSDLDAGNLTFHPALNGNGNSYASMTFQVEDDGGTALGGVNLDPVAKTLTFHVTPVNDAPIATDNTVATNEDVTLTLQKADFPYSDVESHGIELIWIRSLPAAGTLLKGGNAVSVGDSITSGELDAGSLTFVPVAETSGSPYATLTFQLQDNGGTTDGGINLDAVIRTLTIQVRSVNDGPSGQDNSRTTNEDTTMTLVASDFGFSDSDGNVLNRVLLTTVPSAGTLRLNSTVLTTGSWVTKTELDSGALSFVPAPDQWGSPYTSFTFQVEDDGGTLNGGANLDPTPNTLTINVNSVNDAPTGTNQTRTTNEDTTLTIATADFGFVDRDLNAFSRVRIATLPSLGTLNLSGVPVNVGDFIARSDLDAGLLTFTPGADTYGNPYTTFTYQVEDDGGTANGGVNLDPSANVLTIAVNSVNDAPSASSRAFATNEDTALLVVSSLFGFTDKDGNSLNRVQITSLPSRGVLYLNGVPVVAGDYASRSELDSFALVYVPSLNEFGFAYSSFGFQVEDDGGTAFGGVNLDPQTHTLTIDVLPVSDAPQGVDTSRTILEDSQLIFSVGDFPYNDVESDNFERIRVAAVPSRGSFRLNGGLVRIGDFVTRDDLDNGRLIYQPTPDASGQAFAEFQFQVEDSGQIVNNGVRIDPTPNSFRIHVTPVNDAPILDDSGTMSLTAINEDATANPGTLITELLASARTDRIRDVDPDAVEGIAIIGASTAFGTWQYSITPGAWLNAGTISGTQALLLAADGTTRIRFVPSADFNGTVLQALTFLAWDQSSGTNGGTGNASQSGGSTPFSLAVETASIQVISVNDAPASLTLSKADLAENLPVGTSIGIFDATDVDVAESFTYSLVTGAGSADNAFFRIVANELIANWSFNFEARSSYSIRVRVSDSNGGSLERPFNIRVTDIDERPVITGPESTVSTMRPTITWTAVPLAQAYEVWLQKDPGTTPPLLATVAGTSWTPPVDLGVGTYSVWVRGAFSNGVAQWSLRRTFTVITAVTLLPMNPLQPTQTPIIRWNALPDTDRYDVWINDVSRSISQVVRNTNVRGTSFLPTSALPLGQYRVWVRGYSPTGVPGAWSTPLDFSTVQAPRPTVGINSTFDRTPDFGWATLPGASRYELTVTNLSNGTDVIRQTNLTGTTYTAPATLAAGWYRWSVLGVSAQGVRSLASAAIDIHVGGKTVVTGPVGNVTRPVQFTWKAVDGAGQYEIWVAKNGSSTPTIREQNLTSTSYTPAITLAAGTYRVWVRAISVSGEVGAWSEPVTFTLADANRGSVQFVSDRISSELPDSLLTTVVSTEFVLTAVTTEDSVPVRAVKPVAEADDSDRAAGDGEPMVSLQTIPQPRPKASFHAAEESESPDDIAEALLALMAEVSF